MHPSNDDTGASMEMPRYKSHKQVWALEIKDVLPLSYEAQLETQHTPQPRSVTFVDKGYAPIWCPPDMFSRYMPVSGDFFVQYEDGYKSFSSRKAFFEGYSPVT
jgi:hypothetical protein